MAAWLDDRDCEVDSLEERPPDIEDEPVFAWVEIYFGEFTDPSVLVCLLQRDQFLVAVEPDFDSRSGSTGFGIEDVR